MTIVDVECPACEKTSWFREGRADAEALRCCYCNHEFLIPDMTLEDLGYDDISDCNMVDTHKTPVEAIQANI